jgi:Fe-S-cluster containining protein
VSATQGKSPCTRCGACCAFFRVAFYWREAEPKDVENPVPGGLFEDLTQDLRCMKGTAAKHRPKCTALSGRIGKEVGCTIYHNRPTPCREFQFSYYEGKPNPRCDEARRAHGLPPLRREDVR